MAMGPLAVTWLRTEVVEFASAYMNSINNFLYHPDNEVHPDILIFLKSFTLGVRILLL